MRRFWYISIRLTGFLVLATLFLVLHTPVSLAPTLPATTYDVENGIYAPLIDKLAKDGYAQEKVQSLFSPGNDVFFARLTKINLVHREHPAPYKSMYNSGAVNAIREYIEANNRIFTDVSDKYGIAAGFIGAILYVESRFGRSVGEHPVLYVLSSMTLAPEEWNIRHLIEELDKEFPNLTASERETKIEYLRRRASVKADWAYRELVELLEIRDAHNIAIQQLEGSWAGAFGIPQFMPSSFNAYAVDGNDDGKTDITEAHDAIASVANYLYRNGWRGRLTDYQKRKALWRYNHSDPYVDLIMKLATAAES